MTYIATISDALLAARKARTPLAEFPGDLPTNLDDAYAIQLRSAGIYDSKIIGWKVGGVHPDMVEKWQATRMAGPAFEDALKTCEDGDTIVMPIYPGGFAAVEAEYVAVLGDVPDRDVTLDDMDDVVTALHIGVEVASSPMKEINNIGPAAIVPDFGNNAGVIVGPQIDKNADLTAHDVSVTIDGVLAGKKPTGAGDKGPYGAVVFLINHLRAQGIVIPAGTVISTGAVTGVHSADDGSRSHVVFEDFGEFYVELKAQ